MYLILSYWIKDSYTVYVELFLDSLFSNLGRNVSLFLYIVHSICRNLDLIVEIFVVWKDV